GKRLPTDAEWTKAGAWPVESSPGRIAQRRYPWGESFDVRRANIYGSGDQKPGPVDEFPGGVSVGGVHQLIGNVWEWTADFYDPAGSPGLRVARGASWFCSASYCGAYRPGFRGKSPQSRPFNNVGFRCARDADTAVKDHQLLTVDHPSQLFDSLAPDREHLVRRGVEHHLPVLSRVPAAKQPDATEVD
ncbi:MAG: formylglycine-generating enzyme family protein, partial [Acidobacteria bacterium]|nr:formylglycine-generating enzyme family protein [Acidobacteriota bacterium]